MGLFSGRLIFGGAYYWREFCASKWVWLDNNNKDNGVNIREGLLSEGYLRLRFGAAYFRGGGGGCFLSEFYNILPRRNSTAMLKKT